MSNLNAMEPLFTLSNHYRYSDVLCAGLLHSVADAATLDQSTAEVDRRNKLSIIWQYACDRKVFVEL